MRLVRGAPTHPRFCTERCWTPSQKPLFSWPKDPRCPCSAAPANSSDYSTPVQPFFDQPSCQALYKNHVKTMVNRCKRPMLLDLTAVAWLSLIAVAKWSCPREVEF